MSALTRDQADLLIRYGGSWLLAGIVVTPDAGIRQAKELCSGALGYDWTWTTDGRGIHAQRGRRPILDADVELTWTEIRRAVRAVPAPLLTAVAAARKEHNRQIAHRVPVYCPGGYAPFVQPPLEWERDAERALREACRAAVEAVAPTGELALFEVTT